MLEYTKKIKVQTNKLHETVRLFQEFLSFIGNLYITNVQAEDRERAYACMVVNGFLRRFALDKVHFIRPSGSEWQKKTEIDNRKKEK